MERLERPVEGAGGMHDDADLTHRVSLCADPWRAQAGACSLARMRHVALLITIAASLVVGSAAAHAASGPPDSDAPPGASGQWLPAEEWVMERWTPFDEARLYELLGTTRVGTERWLADSRGRRSLAELARRRGIGRGTLTRRLLAPVRGNMSRSRYERLRERTRRMLTQSHLSQHMLFHTFHTWAVRAAARRTLGLSPAEWKKLRDRPRGQGPGLTVAEIARRRGVPVERLRRPVLAAIERTTARGVRSGATSPAQAALQLEEQRWKIEHWPLDRGSHTRRDRAAHLVCDL